MLPIPTSRWWHQSTCQKFVISIAYLHLVWFHLIDYRLLLKITQKSILLVYATRICDVAGFVRKSHCSPVSQRPLGGTRISFSQYDSDNHTTPIRAKGVIWGLGTHIHSSLKNTICDKGDTVIFAYWAHIKIYKIQSCVVY